MTRDISLMMQEDKKEEVTDDDFFNLLNTDRKRTPKEEHLNLEEHNNFADTVGFVNSLTAIRVPAGTKNFRPVGFLL